MILPFEVGFHGKLHPKSSVSFSKTHLSGIWWFVESHGEFDLSMFIYLVIATLFLISLKMMIIMH